MSVSEVSLGADLRKRLVEAEKVINTRLETVKRDYLKIDFDGAERTIRTYGTILKEITDLRGRLDEEDLSGQTAIVNYSKRVETILSGLEWYNQLTSERFEDKKLTEKILPEAADIKLPSETKSQTTLFLSEGTMTKRVYDLIAGGTSTVTDLQKEIDRYPGTFIQNLTNRGLIERVGRGSYRIKNNVEPIIVPAKKSTNTNLRGAW